MPAPLFRKDPSPKAQTADDTKRRNKDASDSDAKSKSKSKNQDGSTVKSKNNTSAKVVQSCQQFQKDPNAARNHSETAAANKLQKVQKSNKSAVKDKQTDEPKSMANMENNASTAAADSAQPKKRTPRQDVAKVDGKANKEPELCEEFVRGCCKAVHCTNVHYEMPYMWQFKENDRYWLFD